MNNVRIVSIDPGNHTGFTWGTYRLAAGSVANAMKNRQESGSTTLEGTEIIQMYEMWDLIKDIHPDEIVIEDFSLVPGLHTPGKVGISPARYAWALVGYIYGIYDGVIEEVKPEIIWQLPAFGMRYNTRKFLEPWGCWVKGREHERAAYAHVGARLMKLYQS